jgi:hypothetical protein
MCSHRCDHYICLISTTHAREPCLSRITQNSVCSRFELGYLSPVFLKLYSFLVSMVRKRISEAQRWQIIGMHTTGMSFKAIGRQMGYHYTVVSQLVNKNTQTNNVKDLPRFGRPRVTSDRDDRALQRLVRRMPFAPVPSSNNTGCPIDVCQQEQLDTVWNQRDLSPGESLNVHCWQTDIDDHVWHGV